MEFDITPEIIKAKENKTLNKPFRTSNGPKKFSVYVKNEKGNVVKVNFGDPNMEIKRDDPNRRKNFRARHNCDNPGPKTKARYWSCKMWSAKSVTDITKGSADWNGETFADQDELLKIYPQLKNVEEIAEADCGCSDCGCGKQCDCGNCEKADCGCSCHEAQASAPKPKGSETHDAYMSRCEKAGYSEGECMKAHEGHKFNDQDNPRDEKDHAKAGLTEKQKKLPPALQKSILKNKSKGAEDYASLWKNIHEKRERIKKGSGEKMKKKGEKGAPTPEQLKKAKDKTKAKDLEDHVALPVLKHKRIASEYSKLWKKINEK